MVINDKYKFAYIHVQKTAGSSLTEALLMIDGSSNDNNQRKHIFINQSEVPQGYYKFSFVRNPWERMVSWWNMFEKKGKFNDFSTYILDNATNFSEFLDAINIDDNIKKSTPLLKSYGKSISVNQLDYLIDENENMIMDFVGRYENLQEDFNTILTNVKLPNIILNQKNKFDRPDYKTFYTNPEDIEKVRVMCAKDIAYFNYEY
jgi:hypothetical protein